MFHTLLDTASVAFPRCSWLRQHCRTGASAGHGDLRDPGASYHHLCDPDPDEHYNGHSYAIVDRRGLTKRKAVTLDFTVDVPGT